MRLDENHRDGDGFLHLSRRPMIGRHRLVVAIDGMKPNGFRIGGSTEGDGPRHVPECTPGSWELKAWRTTESIRPLPGHPAMRSGDLCAGHLLRIIYQYKFVAEGSGTSRVLAIYPTVRQQSKRRARMRGNGIVFRNIYGIIDTRAELLELLYHIEFGYNRAIPRMINAGAISMARERVRLMGKLMFVYDDMTYTAHRGDETMLLNELGIRIEDNHVMLHDAKNVERMRIRR